jgi:hypothetical protein
MAGPDVRAAAEATLEQMGRTDEAAETFLALARDQTVDEGGES